MIHFFPPFLSVISKISLSAERSEIGVESSKNLRKNTWAKTVAVRKREKDSVLLRYLESRAFGTYLYTVFS